MLNGSFEFCTIGDMWPRRLGGGTWLVFASMLIWASSAEAAAPNHLQRPPALKAKEAMYITDVTGRRIRIVGPRFYPNPAKTLMFPGRATAPPDRPKR